MKKILVIAFLLMSIVILSACDSEEVKQAKEAYENKDYDKTVKILSKEKIEDDEVEDILTFSEAYILLSKNKYAASVKKAESATTGKDSEEYKEIYKKALNGATENNAAIQTAAIIKIDNSNEDSVYKKVKAKCDDLNYDAFMFAEKIITILEEGDLKDKLSAFAKKNWKKKVSAFLIADWEWIEQAKHRTVVRVTPYKKDFLGKVIKVGDLEKEYKYKKEDLYWQQFDISDEKNVVCKNLTKSTDGTVLSEIVTLHLNYKKNRITVHLTGTEGYDLRNPDRIWKRLDK